MSTVDNAARARLGKLHKQADELGLPYTPDTTEEVLKEAINQHKAAIAPPKVEKEKEAKGVDLETVKAIGIAVAEAVTSANRKHNAEQGSEDGIVEERYADPNDQLEVPVVYFTPQFFWSLPMTRIGGQKVKPPFGRILFKPEHGSVVKTGNQENTRYISAYRCNSKREQAYIEMHEMFGRRFFKSIKEASAMTNANIKRAERYALHYASLSTKQAPTLYAEASRLGVDTNVTMSLGELRQRIADSLTDVDMENERAALHRLLQSQGKDHLLQQPA